jgi:hypothetical protein
MKSALRLALVIASVVTLAAPAPAQRASMGDRKPPGRHAAKMVNPAPPVRAPIRSGTDYDSLVGGDRASSPYSGRGGG